MLVKWFRRVAYYFDRMGRLQMADQQRDLY